MARGSGPTHMQVLNPLMFLRCYAEGRAKGQDVRAYQVGHRSTRPRRPGCVPAHKPSIAAPVPPCAHVSRFAPASFEGPYI